MKNLAVKSCSNLDRTKYRLSQGNEHVSKSATDKLEYGDWTKDKPSSVATQRPSIHTARSLRSDRARVRLGRYDEDITAEPNQEEPDLTKPDIQSLQDNPTQPEEAKDVLMPIVFKGPITRKRAKILQHKFNESMMLAFDCGQDKPSNEPADEYTSSLETEELSLKNDGPTEKIKPPSKDLWPFSPDQVHPNLLVITIEDQPV
ncbi:hypothetical protein F2Q70_00004114 [Brassica cretica]|uniref:Uncharacterized protein n=1 Tax=Brassica cretica TaxID=69181 RepID=A0A8S9IKE1_BRACR|nr:hypothetical protein F2Q70_00004114 [Brassica cretica]